jgi:predicted transcriptional regulator YheO
MGETGLEAVDSGTRLMELAEKLVVFLGQILGPDTEIALQDLRDNKNCITAICNGHVTGRRVGAPVTELTKRLLSSDAWKQHESIGRHKGKAADGRTLVSSSLFISEGEQLLGLITVNTDTAPYLELSQRILELGGLSMPVEEAQERVEQAGLQETIEEQMRAAFIETGIKKKPGQSFSQDERLLVVEKLMKREVFLIRGAVQVAASRLDCSVASLYRYISMVNLDKKNRSLDKKGEKKEDIF